MHSLFESERRSDRRRSCPHERPGPPGIGAEDHGLLGAIIGRIWIRTIFWASRGFAQVHQIRLPEFVQALNSRYGRQVTSAIDSFS
jgi:hypothetical protein